jgi:hypothetical protein
MIVLVFINEDNLGDPMVFENADAFFRTCDKEEWLENGDPAAAEWELMKRALYAGEDWVDNCGSLCWRTVLR